MSREDNGHSIPGFAYDLDSLKAAVTQIDTNIDSMKKAIEAEEAKKQEYLQHIAEGEAILKLHEKGLTRQ